MQVYTTVPTGDPRDARSLFAELEDIGYDGGFTFESKHDPFLPLALAAGATSRLRLGTAVAIGFARNPMVLANLGYDLQQITGGRFVLGLGSQVRPHIENRFSEPGSTPVGRMRGRIYHVGDKAIPTVVTYHPAYLLRSPVQKRKVWQDLCLARQAMQEQGA